MTAELVKKRMEANRQKTVHPPCLVQEHNEEFLQQKFGVDRKEETYESYENSYNILASFVKKGGKRGCSCGALTGSSTLIFEIFPALVIVKRKPKTAIILYLWYRLKKK